MRLRSTRLPDIKPESIESELELEPSRARARIGRPASSRASSAVSTGTSSPDKETFGVAARRPTRRRIAKIEPTASNRLQAKTGFPGSWSPADSGLPKTVSRTRCGLPLLPSSRRLLTITSRLDPVALAALVSILFLLLVVFRPFASSGQPSRPPPAAAAPPAAPTLVGRPLAPREPVHPSHADLVAQGLQEYTYEKVISHRISLGPPAAQDDRSAAAVGSEDDDAAQRDAAATERKLRELAGRYGVGFDELVRDMAELGRSAG